MTTMSPMRMKRFQDRAIFLPNAYDFNFTYKDENGPRIRAISLPRAIVTNQKAAILSYSAWGRSMEGPPDLEEMGIELEATQKAYDQC